MSSKEDLVIQADNVTIVQGEKAKDYNVIVTSNDDAPLSNIPITIAFYNNDYSFERQTTTNEYGVASVPLYLSGDAWFVDVHFKGNEQYKPQVVTKEIIIEKFERLDSYITSENLVINIDEQSMNGTYYTIYLKDSYDRPIVDEPVYIVVEQTGVDDPQTYVDMAIRTDSNGVIVVPFLSHDENVKITTIYDGCTRFKSCINADIVAFVDVNPRNSIEFRIINLNGYPTLQYKIGDGSWGELSNEDRIYLTPYINIENRYYKDYNMGWFYFDSMDTGTYRITLCFDGQSEYAIGEFANTYPFCRTFTYNNTTDTRKTLSEWIEYQGGSEEDELTISSMVDGTLSHIKLVLDYELPYEITTLITGGSHRYFTLPTYEESDGFYKKTVLEFDVVNRPRDITWGNSLNFFQDSNSFISGGFGLTKSITVYSNSRITPTLTQTGFGEQGQTYQNLNILASVSNAPMHTKINDYCILTFVNFDTMELFYYYTYLVDNVTPVPLSFNLGVGYWRMVAISKDTNRYKGAYLKVEAQLSTDTPIVPPSDNIIVNSENYINLGTDTPTFIDNTITTATTDDDIHSIMALEFTNTNYYVLSFNEIITGNNPTIIIGADPTLETLDGLFISPQKATLYNDGTIVDELIFAESPFKQSPLLNKVRIQRNGNTVAINIDENIIYKTDLIRWNTFGIYQDETDNEIILSDFQLEPYVVTDITPIVSEYDGTVFGSNWHLELREDHLNFVDYGMLPQGAVGGGLVLLNDVPLPKDIDWDLEIGITYNNARYDRLNKLTGEIQARLYEDVSTSESTLEYSELLCSPTPVPNAKTVFTRKSDEGTLYYVKPLYQVSDELGKVMQKPQYMCNPYIQYKGGVECYTETGISLFSLENQYSPVYIGNDLVRAEFHRRSGYIVISRYDDATDSWYSANILKLSENLKLQLNEYNDDYAKVSFGGTTWEFYRGRPFIVVKHPNVDIRILKLVDRVYCETINNEQSMGFIEEHNTMMSTFAPQTSIQKFKQEMHIGQNIKLDNFELYEDEYYLKEKSIIFEDACTSTSNKSSGYVQNTGSYSFDSNGLTIESEPTDVWFTDDGTTASHNSNMQLYQGVRTITNTGTLLETDSNNRWDIRPNNFGLFDTPFNVEFDVVDTSNRLAITLYNSSTSILGEWDSGATLQSGDKIRVEVNDTNAKFYVNDVLKSTKTYISTSKVKFRVFYNVANNYLKYKNFKVFKNYQANLRLDGSNVYNVPFEVSFDLINDGNDNFRCYFYNTSFSNSALGSGSLWTNPSGQTTKIRFVVTHNGIKRYIGNNETSLSLSQDVADKMGVRLGYWQSTQSSIKIKNYKVTQLEYINNIGEVATDSQMGITQIDNDNALVIVKEDNPLALNFPSSSQYLKKPSNQFSLYIGNIDVGNETSITIKARGFDENGAIHLDNNLQYGIWESSQTFAVNSNTTELRATFDCIDQVKYIDFVIFFNTNAQSTIIMNQLMCHDGDSEPNWNVDTSIRNANKVQITFDETYYANLYNEDSPVGLCIIRPNQNPLTLRNISASDETVLAPYMKKANEWDKPQQVFLEYLNANRQIIDIDWEEF